jgi:MFS family permease
MISDSLPATDRLARRKVALRFVLLIGILSFFADFTYEGSRSILGPYLAAFQASATAVAIVTGFGELLGYGLRLVSGRLADLTGRFWPITIFGYVVQMLSVPLLALAPSWEVAGGAYHPRARRQGDPQPAAGRHALPCRQGDGLRVGVRCS